MTVNPYRAVPCLLAALTFISANLVPNCGWTQEPTPDATQQGFLNVTNNAYQLATVLAGDGSPDYFIGVETAQADPALKAQLGVPAEQGLVVKSVAEGSPGAEAGLAVHDVVLTVASQNVASEDELRGRIQDSAGMPVTFALLRAGKRMDLNITPRKRQLEVSITYAGLDEIPTSRWWIGVGLAPADDTLRAQLNLPAGEGLVVTTVEAESPAAKAGMAQHDILVSLDGKRLATVESFGAQVQEIGERTVQAKLLRGGMEISLDVTAQQKSEPATAVWTTLSNAELTLPNAELLTTYPIYPTNVFLDRQDYRLNTTGTGYILWNPAISQPDVATQIAKLKEQLQAMQESLAALEATIGAQTQTQPAPEQPAPEQPVPQQPAAEQPK